MASRILSQDEARARRGPMEGPQRVNNKALAEEDAASTTDPIELFRPSRNGSGFPVDSDLSSRRPSDKSR